MIELQEIKKEGKSGQRVMTVSIPQAENMLRRSKSWNIHPDSNYTLNKEGVIVPKPQKTKKKSAST